MAQFAFSVIYIHHKQNGIL